jgi:mannitol/fructose-specific phosphotransferase system IIA component (Ntr-type)
MASATIDASKPATVVEQFLRPNLFIPELRSHKKASVLEEMVTVLAGAGVTRNPEVVLQLLHGREALGSTAIGKGVAVPHGRSVLIGERAVVCARSSEGVDFDAPDGAPVKLFFLLVAPAMERDPIYLKLLAEVVRAVRLSRNRQLLLKAPHFGAIREALLHGAAE